MSGDPTAIGPDERVLLDSVIVIDHLNGIRPASEFLGAIHGRAALSAITRAEVLSGYAAGEETAVAALLDRFPLLPIDRPVADAAARMRVRHQWRLPDAFQAAVARVHGLLLATRDTRDFPPKRHDFVRVPYELD